MSGRESQGEGESNGEGRVGEGRVRGESEGRWESGRRVGRGEFREGVRGRSEGTGSIQAPSRVSGASSVPPQH